MNIAEQAAELGIDQGYWDIKGEWHQLSDERLVELIKMLANGDIDKNRESQDEYNFADIPKLSWQGESAQRRIWGVQLHLYTLRSRENEGIGDFADLAVFTKLAKQMGASLVGLNPLHALFPQAPEHANPYYPSSRKALNPLYLRISEIAEFNTEEAKNIYSDYYSQSTQNRIKNLRDSAEVDYSGVSAFKLPIFEQLFKVIYSKSGGARRAEFAEFINSEKDRALTKFAIFSALSEKFSEQNWQQWPEQYRRPESISVEELLPQLQERIHFPLYLQWLAQQQLSAAAKDMLYLDMAVGNDPAGADGWIDQDSYVNSVEFGAPPDDFSINGQCWGMHPLNPQQLIKDSYRSFTEVVLANMQFATALRIDHAMALNRLYWIPNSSKTGEGTYIHYPEQELLQILRQQSVANHCLLIGEDLGTVPDGFSQRINESGILSYKLFWFQRYPDGLYKRPELWEESALATLGSHDIYTFAGFWNSTSEHEHNLIIDALRDQQLWSEIDTKTDETERVFAALVALHRFIARTPSRVMMVNLDDLLLETSPLNTPGTPDQSPNWRRKLSINLEDIADSRGWREVLAGVKKERP